MVGCSQRSRYVLGIRPTDGELRKTPQKLEERKKQGEKIRTMVAGEEQTELEVKYSEVLSKIADAHQVDSVTVIALAYVLHKAPYVFPIVGKFSP